MRIIRFQINGIDVCQENGHYLLQKDGVKMRCDFGELNECIVEFENYLKEKRNIKLMSS